MFNLIDKRTYLAITKRVRAEVRLYHPKPTPIPMIIASIRDLICTDGNNALIHQDFPWLYYWPEVSPEVCEAIDHMMLERVIRFVPVHSDSYLEKWGILLDGFPVADWRNLQKSIKLAAKRRFCLWLPVGV
jgi:hypothetical protein